MKKILILLVFSNWLFGQNGCIENSANNFLYLDFPNILNFEFSKIDCDSLIFYSRTASIKRNSCALEVMPTKDSIMELFIFKRNFKDSTLMSIRKFRIKSIPKFEASIGGIGSGTIRKSYLLAQTGLLITNPLNIDLNISTYSYKMLLLRNNRIKKMLNVKNNKFSKNEINLLHSTKSGDRLLLYRIEIIDQNKTKYELNPVELLVIE